MPGVSEAVEYKSALPRYPWDELVRFSIGTLKALGVSEDDAETVSRCLVEADLKGVASHGIVRLPVYAKRLQAGVVSSRPHMKVIGDQLGVVRVIDGGNGLGPVVGAFAMRQAIEAAADFGVGVAVARHSNHFGSAAFYVEMAVNRGFLGICTSNAPPNMAPWGGRERFLGTNPLAVGVPAKEREPIILDMATSTVARGKIILAAEKGESIPLGWAIDPEGNPTTSAEAALLGAVLPFGGAKGSAISLLLDVLSGVLSGAAYGRGLRTLEDLENEQNVGHFFLALDPARFMERETFYERVDDLIDQLKATPTARGVDQVLAPGEIERRNLEKNLEQGVPLEFEVIDQLKSLGDQVGVAWPNSIAG